VFPGKETLNKARGRKPTVVFAVTCYNSQLLYLRLWRQQRFQVGRHVSFLSHHHQRDVHWIRKGQIEEKWEKTWQMATFLSYFFFRLPSCVCLVWLLGRENGAFWRIRQVGWTNLIVVDFPPPPFFFSIFVRYSRTQTLLAKIVFVCCYTQQSPRWSIM
jgi:hypothetical protein